MEPDNTLAIAIADKANTYDWTQDTIDWATFVDRMQQPADHKDCGGYVLGSFRETEDDHNGRKPGCVAIHRTRAGIARRDAITLDADHADPSLPDKLDLVYGWRSVVHTTWRSTPAAPRYRIILPTSRPVDPDEYAHVARVLMEKLGSSQFDPTCDQAERFMYWPSSPNGGYEHWVIDGDVLDVDSVLAEPLPPEPEPEAAEVVTEGQSAIPEDYVREQVAWVKDRLAELSGLGEGERMEMKGVPGGVGWDLGGLLLAQRLVEASNSGTTYSLEDAEADFAEYGPPAAGTYNPGHKWTEAVKTRKGKPLPYLAPAFVPLDDEDDSVASDGEMHDGQVRMAYRFAAAMAGRLLFVRGIGWHYWDGARWDEDDNGRADRAVLGVLKHALGSSLGDKKLRADIRACESASGMAGVLRIASSLEGMGYTADQMDADPFLLNCANGTLDLRDRTLRPHQPADRITKLARGAYDPSASGRVWTEFLERVLPDREERGYLQRVFGQAVYGAVREHLFPVLTGTGANGKGTTYSAVIAALGDYATVIDPEMLMVHSFGGVGGPEMMMLRGARLAVASELGKDRVLDDSLMKRLTGGDMLTARHLYKEPVTWNPTHQLVYVTNHKPRTDSDDAAVWRRMRVIPFDVTIPAEERDPQLGETLVLHADAILTWAVDGWYAYEDGGMAEPATVVKATASYQKEQDDIGRFLDDRCELGRYSVKTGDLWLAWMTWRDDEGAALVSKKAFFDAMAKRGFQAFRGTHNVTMRRGLRLRSDSDE
jgi:putative DNA primase/helicase